MSIGDDSWIEDDGGRKAFKVNGKALRVRKTLVLEDSSGNGLFQIQDRPVRVRDVMEVERASGGTVATVKKAMITPLRERFSMDVAGGPGWKAQGNITDHEYEISVDGDEDRRGLKTVVPRAGHLRSRDPSGTGRTRSSSP